MALGAVVFIAAIGAWIFESDWTNHPAAQAMLAPAPKMASAEAGLDVVEKAANESCMCKRRGGSKDKCATIYSEAREAMLLKVYGRPDVNGPGAAITACAPVSSEVECFEFSDGTKCISIGFYVNGASQSLTNREVCTAEEALAIEQAYQRGWLGPSGEEPDPDDAAQWSAANERANAAVDDTLLRILAGEKIAANKSSGESCVG